MSRTSTTVSVHIEPGCWAGDVYDVPQCGPTAYVRAVDTGVTTLTLIVDDPQALRELAAVASRVADELDRLRLETTTVAVAS